MAHRIELGRVFGIPIQLDQSWFVILALVAWSLATGDFPVSVPGASAPVYMLMGLGAACLLFVCVLLHELGHSVVAKASGIPVNKVTLFIFGGVAQMANDPTRPLVELKVALAGPAVSIALAALCVGLSRFLAGHAPDHVIGAAIVRYLAMVNIALVVFNLLPGLPLDGGRILRAIVWAVSGNLHTATRLASGAGRVLGMGLVVLGVVAVLHGHWLAGLWDVFLGAFLRNAAVASYHHFLVRPAVEELGRHPDAGDGSTR